MIPILYNASESAYTSHGIGPISDATSCIVTEEANGAFELKMRVPRTTARLAELKVGNQILCPPNPYDQTQPFRIKRVTKTHRGELEIYAQHLAYDLAGVPINAFSAANAQQAVASINAQRLGGDAFGFWTDLNVTNPMVVEEPTAAWDLIGPSENTLLYCYGGELKFDRRGVHLYTSRGADRGFVVAYGKNLTELTAEECAEPFFTGILPFWKGENSLLVGNVQNAVTGLGYTKIQTVDLTSHFEAQPTLSQLNAAASQYMLEHKIGEPQVRIKASFVPPGSRGLTALEDVRLWDKVTLRFEPLSLDIEASVVKTAYDVLRERYDYIEIGNRIVSVAQTIAAPVTRIAKNAVKSQAIARGAVGGSKLKKGAVTEAKIGVGAVKSAALGTGAVTEAKIGVGAVKSAAIGAGAVTEPKIGAAAVTAAKVGAEAILNGAIAAGAVSYGKTSFTGTLDQVGVNKANIETLNGYFTGTAHFASVTASNFALNGYQHRNGTVYIDGLRYQVVTWG